MIRSRFALALLVLGFFFHCLSAQFGQGQTVMPPVPPTVEEVIQANPELKAKSDLVAHLRVESVGRLLSYGGVCIEIHSCWYIARCRIVKAVHGAPPDGAKTVDVLFWTKQDATVLGFHLPAERRKRDGFANHVTLARRPADKGRLEPFELVAFLRSTPAAHPLEPADAPRLFAPTSGYGMPQNALTSLGIHKVVRTD